MIPFDCPHCGYHFTVADNLAGMEAWCRICKGMLIVPSPGGKLFEELSSEELHAALERLFRRSAAQADRYMFRSVEQGKKMESMQIELEKSKAVDQRLAQLEHRLNTMENLLHARSDYSMTAESYTMSHPSEIELDDVLKAVQEELDMLRSVREEITSNSKGFQDYVENLARATIGLHSEMLDTKDIESKTQNELQQTVSVLSQLQQTIQSLWEKVEDSTTRSYAATLSTEKIDALNMGLTDIKKSVIELHNRMEETEIFYNLLQERQHSYSENQINLNSQFEQTHSAISRLASGQDELQHQISQMAETTNELIFLKEQMHLLEDMLRETQATAQELMQTQNLHSDKLSEIQNLIDETYFSQSSRNVDQSDTLFEQDSGDQTVQKSDETDFSQLLNTLHDEIAARLNIQQLLEQTIHDVQELKNSYEAITSRMDNLDSVQYISTRGNPPPAGELIEFSSQDDSGKIMLDNLISFMRTFEENKSDE